MKKFFMRCGSVVTINGEVFSLQDITSVVSDYVSDSSIHYYDGKKHYKSDGRNQVGLPTPYGVGDRILENILQIRMCKQQREIDEKHIEHLRNKRR
jgi:hypothetical protein